jgi:hypothetical protein
MKKFWRIFIKNQWCKSDKSDKFDKYGIDFISILCWYRNSIGFRFTLLNFSLIIIYFPKGDAFQPKW